MPRAIVIGGSLGGLFTATLLRSIGWRVTVYERARGNLASRGAGLGSREELFAVLRRAGAQISASLGHSVRVRMCVDRRGETLLSLPVDDVSSAWDRVYAPLRAALPDEFYRQGMSFERYATTADGVEAIFADGSRDSADLLVAADGLNSTLRAQALPSARPTYSGYYAWRFVMGEAAAPTHLREQIFRDMVFCLPAEELAFSIPMPASQAETHNAERRGQCVWFREARLEDELPALCTDASGKCWGLSIPPPFIRKEVIDEAREVARQILPPQLQAFVNGASEPILQPVYDFASPRMAIARVALVGDSSSVMRPHVAAGVTKAALDAAALVDCLRDSADIDTALANYDRQRPPFGARLVERGRWLGASIGRGKPAVDPDPAPGKPMDLLLRGYGAGGVINGEPVFFPRDAEKM